MPLEPKRTTRRTGPGAKSKTSKEPRKATVPPEKPNQPPRRSKAEKFVAALPSKIQESILNPRVVPSEEGLSPAMRLLMFGRETERLVIVKVAKGGITNREEFVKEMAALNYKVVFLEYSLTSTISVPVVERWEEAL